MIEFPFAANALRQAEAITYPAPYVTPLTREGVAQLNAAEQEISRRHIKGTGAQGIRRFNAQDIAEIKRLYREEKLSTHRIARRFGCAQSSIWWHTRNLTHAA